MLAYIQGNITSKTPTHVIIESGGLGYFVNISLNTYVKIQDKSSCKLHTYLHLGGSLQSPITISLYGFFEEAERQIFIELLGISGVGAATVRMILSSMTAEEIQRAIVTENVKLLESIKGIGPKTAKRIILELKDKFGKNHLLTTAPLQGSNNVKEEALSALVMLGFSRLQAEQAVQKVMAASQRDLSTEELIKQTLKAI
ncbi:MAG: Holliday junction branch migration protein RuvA [Chitinophagales bacterium]|nr:Holliday junction branch migration protein RuvA [Chitinophagaceae bacterium]MBP9882851.1 Holliday junction branch migration protein RuvA [Chitinophagales bacterium]